MKIEATRLDWTKPLAMANYRSPGCAYCHMHAANHDVSATVRQDLMENTASAISDNEKVYDETIEDKTRAVCQDCHSPRYITQLFSNGEAMLEIAEWRISRLVSTPLIRRLSPDAPGCCVCCMACLILTGTNTIVLDY